MIKYQLNIDMDKNMEDLEQNAMDKDTKPNDVSGIHVQGHIKIFDPESGEVFIDKRNAIHYENISEAIAYTLANKGQNYIYEIHFGNGGTSVDPTGIINYLPPNVNTSNSNLYNPTFAKIVDNTSALNADPTRNKMEIRHVPGRVYTDIVISCLLDYGEPTGQAAFDNSTNLEDTYTFDELGLKARSTDGSSGLTTTGKLLTHVIFHPVQKSLNRLIQIDYTVRIQTLTNLSSVG
jgi:cold shock CspA family protein